MFGKWPTGSRNQKKLELKTTMMMMVMNRTWTSTNPQEVAFRWSGEQIALLANDLIQFGQVSPVLVVEGRKFSL